MFAVGSVVHNKYLVGISIALRPVLMFLKSLVTKLALKMNVSAEDVTPCLKYCLKLEAIPLQFLKPLAFICKENIVSANLG